MTIYLTDSFLFIYFFFLSLQAPPSCETTSCYETALDHTAASVTAGFCWWRDDGNGVPPSPGNHAPIQPHRSSLALRTHDELFANRSSAPESVTRLQNSPTDQPW